ncbi:putative P-loop containing nucleoside triphosphate hydrolase [Rosa chinensis]|uniref:Putative P-loop containing nucleoside triphosphate hydrolase n=1 Tax=Rosa chinensis TaxID=74649 RepID=A0A2P6Q3G1_ROSCH|nr:putative P-loop containing nucleoside triphosphate hydrolase [Rosa chinensis]
MNAIKAIPERSQRYGVERIEGGMIVTHYDPSRVKKFRQSSFFFKNDDLVGITDTNKKLMGWLLSAQPQRTVISVVGMGGSGKTTLVANTFNRSCEATL